MIYLNFEEEKYFPYLDRICAHISRKTKVRNNWTISIWNLNHIRLNNDDTMYVKSNNTMAFTAKCNDISGGVWEPFSSYEIHYHLY